MAGMEALAVEKECRVVSVTMEVSGCRVVPLSLALKAARFTSSNRPVRCVFAADGLADIFESSSVATFDARPLGGFRSLEGRSHG